jgi:hypothetical protein
LTLINTRILNLKEILIEIYRKCGGDKWQFKDNWCNRNIPVSKWNGVTVAECNGKVTGLDLQCRGLTGESLISTDIDVLDLLLLRVF